MKFNLVLIDPPGNRFGHFLFDVIRMLKFGLQSLGHSAVISQNRLELDRINILVGIHNLDSPVLLDQLGSAAFSYVVLQTEIVDQKSINRVNSPARFQNVFLPLLKGARAVWDSSLENQAALGRLGISADILRFGYQPELDEIRHQAERDIDFFFYGSITPHRRDVLQRLSTLGYRVEACFDQLSLYRNELIARSEVVLTLRQSDDMAHLPHGRILYLVSNHCLVAGDGGTEQQSLEDVFLWTNGADVVELCREARARKDRRELAESFHERLKARPMSEYLRPLVAKLAEAR